MNCLISSLKEKESRVSTLEEELAQLKNTIANQVPVSLVNLTCSVYHVFFYCTTLFELITCPLQMDNTNEMLELQHRYNDVFCCFTSIFQ